MFQFFGPHIFNFVSGLQNLRLGLVCCSCFFTSILCSGSARDAGGGDRLGLHGLQNYTFLHHYLLYVLLRRTPELCI